MSKLKQLPILGEKIKFDGKIDELDVKTPTEFKRKILIPKKYPADKCMLFCNYFANVQKETISKIAPETLLIPIPSSGGFNRLPRYFANQICEMKKMENIESFRVLKDYVITPSATEAKNLIGKVSGQSIESAG